MLKILLIFILTKILFYVFFFLKPKICKVVSAAAFIASYISAYYFWTSFISAKWLVVLLLAVDFVLSIFMLPVLARADKDISAEDSQEDDSTGKAEENIKNEDILLKNMGEGINEGSNSVKETME